MRIRRSVMIIEDDPDDAALIRKAFENAGLDCSCQAMTGREALDYLFAGNNETRSLPSLIILDILMPDIDGLEILRQIKADRTTRRIPVIILTQSDHPEHLFEAYGLGGNSFITKTANFQEKLEKLIAYWFQTVTLPA